MKLRKLINKTSYIFDKMFDGLNICFMVCILIIMLYPLYFVLIASFSEPYDVIAGKVIFWIKGFTTEAYRNTFQYEEIWVGYKNNIINTICSTVMSMLLTTPAAFTLSRKKLPLKSFINMYFVFTMYFGGGLLPTYLMIKDYGLLNKPYTIIVLCGGVGVWNLIVMRTYMRTSISTELFEAAEVDGCSQFRQFIQIAVPLSKPVLAVCALGIAVGVWNNYYTGMIYTTSGDYKPLQTVLREILLVSQQMLNNYEQNTMDEETLLYLVRQAYMAEAIKYAIIFIAALPMLIVYPFVQKYFVKGMMVGSLKG